MTKEEKKEYNKKYYDTHKEELKEKSRKYIKIHKEARKKIQKKYYETHKEEKREHFKKYYEDHKEYLDEKNKKNFKYSHYFRKNFSRFITLKNYLTIMKLGDESLLRSIMIKLGKGFIDQDEAVLLSGMVFTEEDEKEMNEWFKTCRCNSTLFFLFYIEDKPIYFIGELLWLIIILLKKICL